MMRYKGRHSEALRAGAVLLIFVFFLLAVGCNLPTTSDETGPSSGSSQPENQTAGDEGGEQGREDSSDGGDGLSAIVGRALEEIDRNLSDASFNAAAVEAIRSQTVGSLGAAALSDDPKVALPAVVASGEKAVGSDHPVLSQLSQDDRKAAVQAIVEGAVGSIGAPPAESSRTVQSPNVDVGSIAKGIAREAVSNIDDAGIDDIPASAQEVARAAVRALRKAGVTSDQLGPTLDGITSGAMSGVAAAVADDRETARKTVGAITSGVTRGLGEANIEGLEVSTELPSFARRVSATATKSISKTGAALSENDVSDIVHEIAQSTTAALPQALGQSAKTPGGREAVRIAVGEIAEGAAESLGEIRVQGLSVEVNVVARSIARGTAAGINQIAETADEDEDFEEIVKSAHAGTVRGSLRANPNLTNEHLQSLKDSVTGLNAALPALNQRLQKSEGGLGQILDEAETEGVAQIRGGQGTGGGGASPGGQGTGGGGASSGGQGTGGGGASSGGGTGDGGSGGGSGSGGRETGSGGGQGAGRRDTGSGGRPGTGEDSRPGNGNATLPGSRPSADPGLVPQPTPQPTPTPTPQPTPDLPTAPVAERPEGTGVPDREHGGSRGETENGNAGGLRRGDDQTSGGGQGAGGRETGTGGGQGAGRRDTGAGGENGSGRRGGGR